jgi:hypothetical protein
MLTKVFRAFDGDAYWYSNENLLFIKGFAARALHEAGEYFKLEDLEQFTGKIAHNQVKIYENDVIYNPMLDPDKLFQVIWSAQECGFRKVPLGQDHPETKIDEAFMEVLGTIREY